MYKSTEISIPVKVDQQVDLSFFASLAIIDGLHPPPRPHRPLMVSTWARDGRRETENHRVTSAMLSPDAALTPAAPLDSASVQNSHSAFWTGTMCRRCKRGHNHTSAHHPSFRGSAHRLL